jgi:transposase InsO family protein
MAHENRRKGALHRTRKPFGKRLYVESFNGKLRDECLTEEIFKTLLEAQALIERWRHEYNTFRPHSSLGYRPPAPEARMITPDLRKIA